LRISKIEKMFFWLLPPYRKNSNPLAMLMKKWLISGEEIPMPPSLPILPELKLYPIVWESDRMPDHVIFPPLLLLPILPVQHQVQQYRLPHITVLLLSKDLLDTPLSVTPSYLQIY